MMKFSPTQVTRLALSIVSLSAALFSSNLHAQEITLPSYNAVYATKIKGFNIEGYRSLRRGDDGIYQLTMKAKALLMTMSEESHFSIAQNQLMPLRYNYLFKKPIGSNRQQQIHFDWAAMTVDGIYKKPWKLGLTVGMSDRLNVLSALRVHLIANGLSDYQAKIADRGDIKEYIVTPQGNEVLHTPIGDINTVVMARLDDNKKTFFWLAPEMDYQLIKFVQEESDGDTYELNIKSLEFAPNETPNTLQTSRA